MWCNMIPDELWLHNNTMVPTDVGLECSVTALDMTLKDPSLWTDDNLSEWMMTRIQLWATGVLWIGNWFSLFSEQG